VRVVPPKAFAAPLVTPAAYYLFKQEGFQPRL